MKSSITYSVLILLSLSSCIFRSTYKEYFCNDNMKCFTAIQYHKFKDPLSVGTYFTKDKFKGKIPDENYVFVKHSNYALFYTRWEKDKLIFRCIGCEIIEMQITDHEFDFNTQFSEKDKEKYNYYKGKEVFQKDLIKNFRIYGAEDLKRNW